MATCVIYHDQCWDGMTAALIATRKIGGDIDCVGWNYGNRYIRTPRNKKYETVYVLDISVDVLLEQLKKIEFAKCVWIDHHLGDVPEVDDRFEFHINHGHSAAFMTWRYFHGDDVNVPYYVQLVDNYDMFRDPEEIGTENDCVRIYLQLQEESNSFDAISKYFGITPGDDTYVSIIRSMISGTGYRMLKNMASSVVDNDSVRYVNWNSRDGQYLAVVVNAFDSTALTLREQIARYGSFVRIKMKTTLKIIIRVFRKKQNAIVVLRAVDESVNVHDIAVKYGGGGHRGAAAYKCKIEELESVL